MNEEIKQAFREIKRCVIVMMKKVWNVSDLALVLDISESRVRHLAAEQILPSYKRGNTRYFKREEIEAWQTANRIASKDEIESMASTYCATRRIRRK